jgi:hypothetical protein
VPASSKQKTNRGSSFNTRALDNGVQIFFGPLRLRLRISTVVLKSLWKRTVRVTYCARNKALDPVCTKMKQISIKSICTPVAKFILVFDSIPISEKPLGFENKNASVGQF